MNKYIRVFAERFRVPAQTVRFIVWSECMNKYMRVFATHFRVPAQTARFIVWNGCMHNVFAARFCLESTDCSVHRDVRAHAVTEVLVHG